MQKVSANTEGFFNLGYRMYNCVSTLHTPAVSYPTLIIRRNSSKNPQTEAFCVFFSEKKCNFVPIKDNRLYFLS